VFNYLTEKKIIVRDWMVSRAEGAHARMWLAGISFAESSFFPIPTDVFLIAIILSRQMHKWFSYATITTAASVLGGVFGYVIGAFFFDIFGKFILSFASSEVLFITVQDMFTDNAFWAVFIGGFTPIPYKIFTISAGFFGINIFVFIFASVVSRVLRYYSVAYIMSVFGKDVGSFIFRYFNALTLVVAFIIIAVIITMNMF